MKAKIKKCNYQKCLSSDRIFIKHENSGKHDVRHLKDVPCKRIETAKLEEGLFIRNKGLLQMPNKYDFSLTELTITRSFASRVCGCHKSH